MGHAPVEAAELDELDVVECVEVDVVYGVDGVGHHFRLVVILDDDLVQYHDFSGLMGSTLGGVRRGGRNIFFSSPLTNEGGEDKKIGKFTGGLY